MVEYASMRLMFDCAIAARLPIAMDRPTGRRDSCQPLGNCGVSPESGCKRSPKSNRMAIANAASLGPVLMKSVTARARRGTRRDPHVERHHAHFEREARDDETSPNASTTFEG